MLKGLIGKKIGMTRLFLNEGKAVPVTVLQVGPCTVVQVKTSDNEQYNALQLGFGEKKASPGEQARHRSLCQGRG